MKYHILSGSLTKMYHLYIKPMCFLVILIYLQYTLLQNIQLNNRHNNSVLLAQENNKNRKD